MELLETLRRRRSIRNYTTDAVSEQQLERILQAGLLSPSSKRNRPWEMIVVRDKQTLKALAGCRDGGPAKMLEGAGCAIVVIADPEKSDVWIEDCSIVMSYMHLMADSLGLGSCWIQGRLRTIGGLTTEEYLRNLLKFPDKCRLAAILSLGQPAASPDAYRLDELSYEKIHREGY